MDGSEQDRPDGAARGGPSRNLPARRQRRDVAAPIRRVPRRQLPEFTGLSIPSDEEDAAYHEFLPAALQIVRTPPSRTRRLVLYVVCGSLFVAIAWSIFGQLRLFAIAPGEVQPRGGTQVVESLETGQVSAIPVKNGDHVKANDPVLQLDPTAAKAAKTIIESKLVNARAESIRRGAAIMLARAAVIDTEGPISWPKDIPADVRKREESVLHADLAQLAAMIADLQAKLKVQISLREKYTANIAAQKILVESRTQRTAMHEQLAALGRDSRAQVLQSQEPLRQDQVSLATYEGSLGQANAQIPVINKEMDQAREEFAADNTDKAAAAERQVADLVQQLRRADQVLSNLTLRATASGTVQSLAVTSTGQAVKVGELLAQIVPDGAPLEVQAYVLNKDIGFVKVGQPVTIKVDTFPYTRYGTIAGRVTHIGADAVTGAYAVAQQKNDATTPSKGSLSATNAAQQMSDLVFPVTVVPAKTSIKVDGRDVPLASGMSVVAEIETARQRAISYILYPLTRVFGAASS